MKMYWASKSHPSFAIPAYLIAQLVVPSLLLARNRILIAIVAIGASFVVFAIIARISFRKSRVHTSVANDARRYFVALTAAMLALAAYSLGYAKSPGALPWYTANLVVPVIVVVAGVFLTVRASGLRRIEYAALAFVGVSVLLNIISALQHTAPFPWQQNMYLGGLVLHDQFPGKKAAAWNAGIINYYEGGHVINLDGLVNHDVHAAITTGQLERYLREKNIILVADFSEQWRSGSYALQGGFPVAFLDRISNACVTFPETAIFSQYQIRQIGHDQAPKRKVINVPSPEQSPNGILIDRVHAIVFSDDH